MKTIVPVCSDRIFPANTEYPEIWTMTELNRMVIYTKDVQRITGRTDRYARKILSKIRAKYGKKKHQLVSLTELCEYMGLNVEDVAKYID